MQQSIYLYSLDMTMYISLIWNHDNFPTPVKVGQQKL